MLAAAGRRRRSWPVRGRSVAASSTRARARVWRRASTCSSGRTRARRAAASGCSGEDSSGAELLRPLPSVAAAPEQEVASALGSAEPRPSAAPKVRTQPPTDVPSSAEGHTVLGLSTEATLSAPSFTGSSPSARSTSTYRSLPQGAHNISWGAIKFGHRIQPLARLAHRPSDPGVLSSFLELAEIPDISGDSVKLLLRALKLLRSCHYDEYDIFLVLAHASAYFVEAYAVVGHTMSANEMGNVLATLIFLAHCWVHDETCPLRIWHDYLFKKYCELGTLNEAVLRLMQIRGYVLRVDSEEVERRMEKLIAERDAAESAWKPAPRMLPPCSSSGHRSGAATRGSTFLQRGLGTILDSCVSRSRVDTL